MAKVKSEVVAKEIKKDKYGCQLGKPPAKINEALTGEVRTVEEIAAAVGLPVGRVKTHLRYWLSQTHGLGKYLRKSATGWCVKASPKRPGRTSKKVKTVETITVPEQLVA